MTSLVSEFLINPVLRTARRFSRSNSTTTDDITNPAAFERIPRGEGYEDAVEDIAARLEGLQGERPRGNGILCSPSSEPPTVDSIEEDDRSVGTDLRILTAARSPSTSLLSDSAPIGLISEGLSSAEADDDVSDSQPFSMSSPPRTNLSTTNASSNANANTTDARMRPEESRSRHMAQDPIQPVPSSHHRNRSLPADDGMGALRQQIIMIQAMEIPAEEKARLMHRLLIQGYTQAQIPHDKQQPLALSPAGTISQERPTSPASLSSFLWQMNGAMDDGSSTQQHTFHLSPDDLQPSYAPLDPPEIDGDGDIGPEPTPELGCRHYKRNVKLQCSTCDRWYTCRMCHDEVESHILNRKLTKNMLCMLCGCAQRAGEFCVGCGERTAWYYCDVCKLWDNDPNKSIYHCNDCGICRKGRGLGKDFFHCKTCGVCMSMSVEHFHKCIERVSDCDCPICEEYMFTSPYPVVFMLCGHSIHKSCYEEHMKTSYKCPICSKSTVNMETQFRNLDRAIDNQPMPPQFQDTKAMVSCNDCYAKSAVKYHWLGLKCAICDSYNTAQLSILSDLGVEVSPNESRGLDDFLRTDLQNSEMIASGNLSSGRRHSSHIQSPMILERASNQPPTYPAPQRIGRSVSADGRGSYDEPPIAMNTETDDSADEDELDFWGRDKPRSVTSAENADEMEEDEESEDDSGNDDCDEDDGDDEDQFELIGHR